MNILNLQGKPIDPVSLYEDMIVNVELQFINSKTFNPGPNGIILFKC